MQSEVGLVLMNPSVLQRIGAGDSGAVRECIDQYGSLVWSLARRLTRTSADAEDATQEIFLHIWKVAKRFDASLGSETTFISVIARRRLIDRLRKAGTDPITHRLRDRLELFKLSAEIDSVDAPPDCIEVDRAMQALARLAPTSRQVIELGYLYGLTHPEIAERLSLPLGTVKSHMRRGLRRLRESLEAMAATPVLRDRRPFSG